MKNFLHRVLNALNINGREWAILALALLLAFSIWLIHNLSLKYNDYLSVPVIARCELYGHSDISANKSEVIARCRATGYKVIRSSMKSKTPVEVTFRPSDINHLEGDTYYVTSQNLQAYANFIYGADVSVEYFVTDTLFFRFPLENCRKVPVVPIFSLNYRDQYMADGEIAVSPDSVLIYGEPFHIENIDAVYTKPIRFSDISGDIRGVIDIENVKGVRMSEQEAHFSLDVKRFVEISSILPVKTVNVPADKVMRVYPSVVKVSVRCNFPLQGDPLDALTIEADYNDLNMSLSGKCELKPVIVAKGVIDCEIEPVAVSCVLEEW